MGRNAFAHEAGIHQDGMLKDRRTYEIMRPEDVGVTATTYVLGKHSGRHAFADSLEKMGLHLQGDALNQAFVRFKELADRKKIVRDHDLLELWGAMKRAAPRAKAPAAFTLRDEASPADEAGYGHGV